MREYVVTGGGMTAQDSGQTTAHHYAQGRPLHRTHTAPNAYPRQEMETYSYYRQPSEQENDQHPPPPHNAEKIASSNDNSMYDNNRREAAAVIANIPSYPLHECCWMHPQKCGQVFQDGEKLLEHIKACHLARTTVCWWENCKRGWIQNTTGKNHFKKKDNALSHIRIHLSYFPHYCELCKKPFKRHSDYKKHVKQQHESACPPAPTNSNNNINNNYNSNSNGNKKSKKTGKGNANGKSKSLDDPSPPPTHVPSYYDTAYYKKHVQPEITSHSAKPPSQASTPAYTRSTSSSSRPSTPPSSEYQQHSSFVFLENNKPPLYHQEVRLDSHRNEVERPEYLGYFERRAPYISHESDNHFTTDQHEYYHIATPSRSNPHSPNCTRQMPYSYQQQEQRQYYYYHENNESAPSKIEYNPQSFIFSEGRGHEADVQQLYDDKRRSTSQHSGEQSSFSPPPANEYTQPNSDVARETNSQNDISYRQHKQQRHHPYKMMRGN
eukprot:Awhi_evm1s15039